MPDALINVTLVVFVFLTRKKKTQEYDSLSKIIIWRVSRLTLKLLSLLLQTLSEYSCTIKVTSLFSGQLSLSQKKLKTCGMHTISLLLVTIWNPQLLGRKLKELIWLNKNFHVILCKKMLYWCRKYSLFKSIPYAFKVILKKRLPSYYIPLYAMYCRWGLLFCSSKSSPI